MTRPIARARHVVLVAAGAAILVVAGPAVAHGPDPLLGGSLWSPNQVVGYGWVSGHAPPGWAATAIDAGAGDVTESRSSKAATFVHGASPSSFIAYGEPTGCSAAGIACFDRSGAPSSFKMWFRAHGFTFDWGTLRWCQGLATIANGCFDIENIALDEFGHVEILAHHVNNSDGSDYLDAVVQTVSHARPAAGWDAHVLGRCDVARLQLEYERQATSDRFSNCLVVPTTLGLGVNDASIYPGQTIRFTATLKVSDVSTMRALRNDPISGRLVQLQRRPPGATTWTTIATMASTSPAGSYTVTTSPTATYEWRARYTIPAGDGSQGSASAPIKVTVSGSCSGCAQSAPVAP